MKRTIRGLALTLTVTALSCLSALAMGSDPVSVLFAELLAPAAGIRGCEAVLLVGRGKRGERGLVPDHAMEPGPAG